MFKKLAVVAVFMLATLSMSQKAGALAIPTYDHFCHGTNSASNPYSSVPFSQSYSEIDGQGNNDHTLHTGPVVTTQAAAQALKTIKLDWGDIIPPVPNVLPAGYNWDAAGQSVYNSGCAFPEVEQENPANIQYTVTCNDANTGIVVSIANIGQLSGVVTVNGENITLAGGEVATRKFDSGVTITIVVSRQTGYNKAVTCEQPSVPVTPATTTPTPVTPARAPLPDTSSNSALAIVTLVMGAVTVISMAGKIAYNKFF